VLPVGDVELAKDLNGRLALTPAIPSTTPCGSPNSLILLDLAAVGGAPAGRSANVSDRFRAGTLSGQCSPATAAHENSIGAADQDWPGWHGAYIAANQAGTELPR
jgi:hypothetical protein